MFDFIVALRNLITVVWNQVQSDPTLPDIIVAFVLGLCVLQGLIRGLASVVITAVAVAAGYMMAKSQWALDLMAKYTGLENPIILAVAVFLAVVLLGSLVRGSIRNIFRNSLTLNLADKLAGGLLGLMIGCAVIVVGSDLLIDHFGQDTYENHFSSKSLEATKHLADTAGASEWFDMFKDKSAEYAKEGVQAVEQTIKDPDNQESIENWVRNFRSNLIHPKDEDETQQ